MYGAAIEGIIAGIAVVLVIEFIDKVCKVDDPVGAVGVHLQMVYSERSVSDFSQQVRTVLEQAFSTAADLSSSVSSF